MDRKGISQAGCKPVLGFHQQLRILFNSTDIDYKPTITNGLSKLHRTICISSAFLAVWLIVY